MTLSKVLPPTEETIRIAVELLQQGEVIIFPTETVYGIGASIEKTSAIEKIFQIKGRSFNQPLLVHCGSINQLPSLVREVPPWAKLLIERFWPGPLALVFFRSPMVPDIVTAGKETVGIRMVNNPIFTQISQGLNAPLAGTSANFSKEPPTNNFSLIPPELLSRVALGIDAGITGDGRPSTIVDCTVFPPRLLREGAISYREILTVCRAGCPETENG